MGTTLAFHWCVILVTGGIAVEPSSIDERVARLIRDLDDDRFRIRQTATEELAACGLRAIGPLVASSKSPKDEVSFRSVAALATISKSQSIVISAAAHAALWQLAQSNHPVAAARARQVLQGPMQAAVNLLVKGGAVVGYEGDTVVSVDLDQAADPQALVPLLHKLPTIKSLSVSNPKWNDECMSRLSGLPNLTDLNLFGSSIGNDGLKVLKSFPRLKSIPMGRTKITDDGLAHLSNLVQLEYVGLRGNKISDGGLLHLKKLNSLTGLYLGETNITDAGLAHLSALKLMTYLRLHNTAISDAGLEHLHGMSKLQLVELWNSKVTDAGVAKLKQQIPSVNAIRRNE
jgi:hypothetical protein